MARDLFIGWQPPRGYYAPREMDGLNQITKALVQNNLPGAGLSTNRGGDRSYSTQSSSGGSTGRSTSTSTSTGRGYGYNFGDSESFQGIDDPEALSVLKAAIKQFAAGGDAASREQRARRLAELDRVAKTYGDFSKEAAGADAAGAVAAQMREAMERNMPAVQKATQGAGTSAASAAALYSNDIAARGAEAAARVAADQMAKYGSISAGLAQTLEAFTRMDNSNNQNLLEALGLMRVGRSTSTSRAENWSSQDSSSNSTSTQDSWNRSSGESWGPPPTPQQIGGSAGGSTRSGSSGGAGAPLISGSRYAGGGMPTTSTSNRTLFNNNPARGAITNGYVDITPRDPFYYDDWGLGSDGRGGMSGAGYNMPGGNVGGIPTSNDYNGVNWNNYDPNVDVTGVDLSSFDNGIPEYGSVPGLTEADVDYGSPSYYFMDDEGY
jgi:hypothetical protein